MLLPSCKPDHGQGQTVRPDEPEGGAGAPMFALSVNSSVVDWRWLKAERSSQTVLGDIGANEQAIIAKSQVSSSEVQRSEITKYLK